MTVVRPGVVASTALAVSDFARAREPYQVNRDLTGKTGGNPRFSESSSGKGFSDVDAGSADAT
jgi:hypothetical protein